MKPLLVHPSPAPPDVARALDLASYSWSAVATAAEIAGSAPAEGWGGAVISISPDGAGWEVCRSLRRTDPTFGPIVVLVSGRDLDELTDRDDLYDDFCLMPFHPREFEARLTHALWRAGHRSEEPDLVVYEDLVLNVETYEAEIAGRPLELTFMEYELLKFLASNPGRVYTREVLLSQVWGYDYFGGARTVDVHIRRLRSKLGEDHAGLIHTIRSVGYSLGGSRGQG